MDVTCSDGVVITLPAALAAQCATLVHMIGDCRQQCAPVCVPFPSAIIRSLDVDDCASWDNVHLVDALQAADFLAHEGALRALAQQLGTRLEVDALDEWALPLHLLCVVAQAFDNNDALWRARGQVYEWLLATFPFTADDLKVRGRYQPLNFWYTPRGRN